MRVRVLQRVNQLAVGGVAGHDGRPEGAALDDPRPAVQGEVAFGLLQLAVVAGVALRRENRADPGFEELVGDRLRAGRTASQDNQGRAEQRGPHHCHQTSLQTCWRSI